MLNIKILASPHPFAANTYLISSAGEYAIIDPAALFDKSLLSGKLKYILLTHAHFDHILEIDSWANATDAKVIISSEGVNALSDPIRNCYRLYDESDGGYFGVAEGIRDGERLYLGDSEISFIHTPGHTAESGVYLCDGCAFVGDTIFEGGGFGRYDLPSGNFTMLRESIRRLIGLPDDTVVYAGHGPSTTIKQYKLHIER